MSRLVTVPIARSSAEQRKGRAGRLGPGLCLRLWSIEEERGRAAQRPPEIEEADLAPLALELAVWGVRDPGTLRLPTPPPAGTVRGRAQAPGRAGRPRPGRCGDGARPGDGRAAAASPPGPHAARRPHPWHDRDGTRRRGACRHARDRARRCRLDPPAGRTRPRRGTAGAPSARAALGPALGRARPGAAGCRAELGLSRPVGPGETRQPRRLPSGQRPRCTPRCDRPSRRRGVAGSGRARRCRGRGAHPRGGTRGAGAARGAASRAHRLRRGGPVRAARGSRGCASRDPTGRT